MMWRLTIAVLLKTWYIDDVDDNYDDNLGRKGMKKWEYENKKKLLKEIREWSEWEKIKQLKIYIERTS